jgi:hypothetical protein
LLDEEWQPSGVIDVRMTQHHGIHPPGIERKVQVERVRLRPAALKQARIEQNAGAGGLEQVHGTGDLAGRAPEGESR